MNKNKIQLIVGLMCLSLIGLIAFQGYWIKEALDTQKEQFMHRVGVSVQNVVHKIEKQEIVYLLRQRQQLEEQKEHLRRMSVLAQEKKSEEKKRPAAPPQLALRQPQSEFLRPPSPLLDFFQSDALTPSVREMMAFQQQILDEFFALQQIDPQAIDAYLGRRMQEEQLLNQAMKEVEQKNLRSPLIVKDEPSAPKTKVPQIIPKATSPEVLMKEVIEDVMYTKRPIRERINRFLMDSLLRQEFQQHGINLPFSFGVKSNEEPQMLFATAQLTPDVWEQSAYKTTLFPGEMTASKNWLYVYFPGQRQFVLQEIGAMMAGSGVLIIVVMVCFYMAVSTIIKQKKLSDIKNDFINNMTHEFKTPISTIALAVDMAGEGAGAGSGLERYLSIIKEENKRLSTHVEKVLQVALLDKGRMQLKEHVVNMHDLIDKVLNNLSVQIEQKKGEVEIDYQAVRELVSGDVVHLTNVLYNLIDNAIKYSPQRLHIGITTLNREGGIEIQIADRGIGLSKEQQSRIFDKFYRVPTGNLHDVKGFGLGLSYVKLMMEAHQGTVTVQSKEGQGTTMQIWLPNVD